MMLVRRIADLLADGTACALLCLPAGDGAAEALAALIGPARVLAHPLAPPGWRQPSGVPLALAARDRDIPCRPATLWPGAAPLLPTRQRRADRLYDRHDIGVLALADVQGAAAVLLGARALLARCRPAVLLDLRGTGNPGVPPEVFDLLPGYAWAELAAGLFEARLPPLPGWPPSAWPLPGWPPPGAEAPGEWRTTFDDALVCHGLHPAEPGAPLGGRWTGASQPIWFMLPRPPAGSWRLRLAIADQGHATDRVVLRIEHQLLRYLADAQGYGPFELTEGNAPLCVWLLAPRPVPDMIRWPRLIGLRILAATLVPA